MKDVRYYHFRLGRGDLTFYTRWDAIDDVLYVGFSACSPKDQFNKAFGRKVAEGRALKCPIVLPFSGNSYDSLVIWLATKPSCLPAWANRKLTG